MRRNFTKSLIAVLGGNAVYFLLLSPHLPAAARHQTFHSLDLGMLIDFWVCVVCYGLIELLLFLRRAHSRP